jgi:hypothetical protein
MLSGKSGSMGGGEEMSYGSGMQSQHSGLKKTAQNNEAPEMTEQPIMAEGEVTVDDLPF